MIKKETKIPVPTVYAFNVSFNNEVQVPFILMEMIDGIPLGKLWFEPGSSKARLERIRKRVLRGLAKAMTELNQFTINRGGALIFGLDGTPVGVTGAKAVENLTKWNEGQLQGDTEEETKEITQNDPFCEKGPFHDAKTHTPFNLDRPDAVHGENSREIGAYKSPRLFIDWAFAKSAKSEPDFVLSTPRLGSSECLGR